MDFIRSQYPVYFSRDFDFKIWFRAFELPGLSRNGPQAINSVGNMADFGQGFGKRAAHPPPNFSGCTPPWDQIHVSQVNVMYNKITLMDGLVTRTATRSTCK